jgi:hypothetical protein
LIKAVEVTIFAPGNKQKRRERHVAPPGRCFSDKGVDILLEKVSAKIEKAWPTEDYSLVPLGAARFNFVHRGSRPLET